MDIYNIKQTISTYFRAKHLSRYKLPQAYILYRALQKIGKEPTLVKGYLVNHFIQNYYISFWVMCDGELHNIIDETLTYSLDQHTELVETLSPDIQLTYLNMDAKVDIELINKKFNECLNGSEKMNNIINPLFRHLEIVSHLQNNTPNSDLLVP